MPTSTPNVPGNATWYRRWILANAWAELLGLGAVAAAGYAAYALAGPRAVEAAPLAFAAMMVALGALEGAVVGIAQRRLLRLRLPALSGWTRASVAGAVAAWALGLLPGLLIDLGGDATAAGSAPAAEPPLALTLLLAAALGAFAGPVLAAAQWLSLKQRVGRAAWRWLPANALAWALAMPVVFLAVDLAQRVPPALTVPVVALCLLAAGVIAGAVHGRWLLRILAQADVDGASSSSISTPHR